MVPDAITLKTDLNSVSYVFSGGGSGSQRGASLLLGAVIFSLWFGFAASASMGTLVGMLVFLAVAGVGFVQHRRKMNARRNQIQVEPSGLLVDMDTSGRVTRIVFEAVTNIEVYPIGSGECDLCIERFDADGLMLGLSLQASDAAWLQERLEAHWLEWRERAEREGHNVEASVQPSSELRALQSLVVDSAKKQR